MSRRRYISTRISLDTQVNRLAVQYGDFAALLYTWMIPHAEDNCLITGDPEQLLLQVVPGRRDKTVQDVEAAIEGMVALGLIRRAEGADGRPCLQFPPESFYRYQTYIPEDKRVPVLAGSGALKDSQRKTARNAEDHNSAPEVAQNAASPSPSPSPTPTVPPPDPPPAGEGGESQFAKTPKPEEPYTEDFEAFWRVYPLKVEKRRAFKCWRQRLREGWKPDQLIQAARNYADAKRGTERDYIKHPSTFLSRDRPFADWIEPTEAALVRAEEERADRPIPVVTDREAYLAELERKRREVERIRAARFAVEGG